MNEEMHAKPCVDDPERQRLRCKNGRSHTASVNSTPNPPLGDAGPRSLFAQRPATTHLGHGHDQHRHGIQDHEKVETPQFNLASNMMLGESPIRAAVSPTICSKCLCHQKYNETKFQSLGNRQCERHHRQHCDGVIAHGREPNCHQGRQHQQAKRFRVGPLGRPDD